MGTSLGSQVKLPEVDLSQKTIIVTGANTGIGYETAKALAQTGAKVIVACRSETKANEAISQMRKENEEERADETKAKVKIKVEELNLEFMALDLGSLTSTMAFTEMEELNLEFMALDLGSLASTMSFIEAYKAKGLPLHILVCNAGIMWHGEDKTADGFEPHFQINYLSHTLIILHLIPLLKASAPNARIVLVSSLMHRIGERWDPSDFQSINRPNRDTRYSNSKLYQIMQMFSLARRLEGSDVSVFSLHPGVVNTELTKREGQTIPWMTRIFMGAGGSMKILRSPFQGALSSLHAAANPAYDGKTAIYFDDSKPHSLTSLPRNKEKQEMLWKYTMDLLKEYMTEDTLREWAPSDQTTPNTANGTP